MSQKQFSEQELLARISELESELKKSKPKKYGLVWEEHQEDVVLQCQNSVPILKEVKNRKVSDNTNSPTNVLIEGDNYHALSVLNYSHKGKIDVIYIDPPYNTGATDWKYNNDYVDNNDQWRHSKWISFMNNRLWLAKNLLSKNGVLVCAIDHNEQEALGLLLQEIFPDKNISCVTVIHNPAGIQGDNFSYTHEFLYFVYPNGGRFIAQQLREEEGSEDIRNFRDVTGDDSLRTAGANCFYPVLFRDGEIIGFGDVCDSNYHPKINVKKEDGVIEIYPVDPQGVERKWRFARQTVDQIKNELKVKFIKARGVYDVIRIKNKFNYKTVWMDSKYSANNHGTQLLNQIIEPGSFSFPKSIYAVIDSIKAASNENKSVTVLDFFAGSGTTGHAVLELNKQDGGNRKFILCTNNENEICEKATYPRIRNIIKGYKNKKGEKVDGLGGKLRYFKTELFDVGKISRVTDDKKLALTYRVGGLLALKENTFEEVAHTDHWQIFREHNKATAVYFSEDKTKLHELITELGTYDVPVKLYVFSWSKNEYASELSDYPHIAVLDIPEPILAVYREINNL